MKKKSARDIPDFSRQPTKMASGGGHGTAPQQPGGKPARQTPAPAQAPKPQATSSKSGRRGQ